MQVFKLFFKILKRNLPLLLIYIVVFIGVSAIFSSSGQAEEITEFSESQMSVAFINRDSDSVFIYGLIEYISEKADIVEVADDKDALSDALFYGKVDYIVIISEGFAESFLSGEDAKLSQKSVPDSTSAIYTEMLINNYLNNAKQYITYLDGITQEELVSLVADDMANETEVLTQNYGSEVDNGEELSYIFNFSAYSLVIIMILGTGTFLMVFNDPVKKQRTLCSPLRNFRIGMETILAMLLFSVTVWLIMLAVSYILIGSELLTLNGLLWAVNMLIITIVGLSLGYLFGNFVKTQSAQSAVANTVGLGLSFISGCFVPQSLLSDSVLSVSKFFPFYWYVKASDEIGSISAFNWENLKSIIFSFLIQLGFAAVFVCIALVITKQKNSGGQRIRLLKKS